MPTDRIDLDLVSTWTSSSVLSISFDSEWNIGAQRLYWYRVEGSCAPYSGCPPADFANAETCNSSMFILNILSDSVAGVCVQLRGRNLTSSVKSLKRSSVPALKSERAALAATGVDVSCETFQEVPFCNLAECLDLCVDYDVRVRIGVATTVYRNSFGSDGGIQIGGRATINFRTTAPVSGGGVLVGGTADIIASVLAFGDIVGGPVLGGSAYAATSSWSWAMQEGLRVTGSASVTSSSFSF